MVETQHDKYFRSSPNIIVDFYQRDFLLVISGFYLMLLFRQLEAKFYPHIDVWLASLGLNLQF